MPTLPASRPMTIQGVQFTVKWPYAAGHTVNSAEAEALNMARAENVRNNFAKRVKATRQEILAEQPTAGEATIAQLAQKRLQDEFNTYDAEYEFGVLSPRAVDPIGREAQRIAVIVIAQQLNSQGKHVEDISRDQHAALVAAAAALPAVRAEAERRVNAMAAVAEQALDDIITQGEGNSPA